MSAKSKRPSPSAFLSLVCVAAILGPLLVRAGTVAVQAESGLVGSDFVHWSGVPSYITIGTSSGAYEPGNSARVARYEVTFPEAGTYRLFARIYVGAGNYDDDSMFFGNGFGAKDPAISGDWKMVNGLAGVGFSSGSDVVSPAAGNGSAGSQVWKWVDLSALGSTTFTVSSNALTRTLDIGGREDGLCIDSLCFGLNGETNTVDDLDQATGNTGQDCFTLEAEESMYGGEFALTPGTPSYISVTNTISAPPFTSARVARFNVVFPAAASYRLYARVRVGPEGGSDDSLFLGNGFGAKDPAVSGDWITVNLLSGRGFADRGDVVDPSQDGSAGTEVWKWIDLTRQSGLDEFVVTSGALSQTLDIAGRENGFDIDKLFFGPADTLYTVADLDSGGSGAVVVELTEFRQEIDGFGASSAWTAQNISDEQADLFFSTSTNSIGLSLLRVRISPEGTTWETATAQKAIARGAKVWATPWSPPGEWKSNGTVTNGGTLLAEYHDDWAQRLSDFVVNMNNAGVPLEAISAQNEPNYTAAWETCRWTPEELTAFIRDYLGPALASNGLPTRVLAGEPIGWKYVDDYGDALLADATASSYLTHVATHSYGDSVPFVYTAPADNGKRLWQTEYTDEGATSDLTMDSGLRVASDIHDGLTVAEVNAWHYWWLRSGNSTTGALMENGVLAKRGWVMGNWSRFVRPGYRRVQTYGATGSAKTTAFVSPDGQRVVLVAVNSGSSAVTVPVSFEGGSVASLLVWETSATRSLEQLDTVFPSGDGSFQLEVPARSVITFAYDADTEPPTPNAATFASAPAATGTSRITMTATSGSDASGSVEYYFTCTSGGGHDSGWQTSATYTDSGLSAGSIYSYTVTMRDAALTPNVGAASAPHSAATFASSGEFQESGGVVSMEAENGTVGSRWIIGSDASASGGAYIEIDSAYDNTTYSPESTAAEALVSYEFNISTGGNYRFWFRMHSDNAADDSFFWRIDNGSWNMENNRYGIGSWYSTDNTQVNSLATGIHVLQIAYRENGTRLDKFVIQLDGSGPSGDGPAESTREHTGNYVTWSVSLPEGLRAEDADGNGDGVANVVAYALGYAADETVPHNPAGLAVGDVSGGTWSFSFLLPADAPQDVRYQIVYTTDLAAGWTALASKEGNGAWQGANVPAEEVAPDDMTRVTEVIVMDSDSGFCRLWIESM